MCENRSGATRLFSVSLVHSEGAGISALTRYVCASVRSNEPWSPLRSVSSGAAVGQIHLGELAGDADGVQHGEGAVPEPVQPVGDREAALLQGEESVPDHLGGGPGCQHGGVERADGDFGEGVGYAPYYRQAAEDLQEGGEDWRRDNACEVKNRLVPSTEDANWIDAGIETHTQKRVEDLQRGKGLRVADEGVDADGHQCRPSEQEDGDDPAQNGRPCYRRGGIVEYQVAFP
jgi:hypothetical protein